MVDRPVDQSHLECNKISLASHLKCNALHFSLTQIIENTQCASLGFKPKSTAVSAVQRRHVLQMEGRRAYVEDANRGRDWLRARERA